MAGMQQAWKQSPVLNQVMAGVYVFTNSISNEIGKSGLQMHFLNKKRERERHGLALSDLILQQILIQMLLLHPVTGRASSLCLCSYN